jgi:hypothetical protein
LCGRILARLRPHDDVRHVLLEGGGPADANAVPSHRFLALLAEVGHARLDALLGLLVDRLHVQGGRAFPVDDRALLVKLRFDLRLLVLQVVLFFQTILRHDQMPVLTAD